MFNSVLKYQSAAAFLHQIRLLFTSINCSSHQKRFVWKDRVSPLISVTHPSKNSATTLHQRNLQKLLNEIFKVKTGIAPKLIKSVFEFTDVPLI